MPLPCWLLLIVLSTTILPVLALIFSRIYRIDRRPDVTHHLRTPDGWRLALSEYRPSPDAAARDVPVLICHGLSGNHYGFDFTDRLSIARYLANRGHRVFLMDLRGAGDSEKIGFFERKRYSWNFDSYVRHDVPACVDAVLRIAGAKKTHWMGHSMGGMIGYSIAQTPLAEKLASVTTICSPGRLDQFKPMLFARPFLERFRRIWLGWLMQVVSPIFEYTPLFQKISGYENLARGDYSRSVANLVEDVPVALLLQFGDWASEGRVKSRDGYDYTDGLSRITIPFCAFASENDLTANPDSVREIFERVGSAAKRFHPLGRSYGMKGVYGHMTPLIGRDAPEEVYPLMSSWLEEGWKGDDAQQTEVDERKRKPSEKPALRKKRTAK